MKMSLKGFVYCFSTLCSVMAFAQPPPPEDTDPAPPGLSINEDVFVLFIAAILLGIYIISGT
jgi:hypothetical protein